MNDAEFDEAQADFEREHRLAQRALNRKHIDLPPGKVMRYQSVYDESEQFMCDKVWIDCLTGHEVMRYDAADPANTNSYYGARPDEETFVRKGLNFYETIDAASAKPLPRFPIYDDGSGDDGFFDLDD
jgi:hypothetical protein